MLHVDIVIPTWRRQEKLERCLDSIQRQTYPYINVHAINDVDRLFAFGVWNRFLADWDNPWRDGDCFVYICDDVELSPGCIASALCDLERLWPDGDGMVGFHQSIAGRTDGWSASAMGLVGLPGNTAYSAAKGGVIQFTKTMALEYASSNVRVNCICAGWIDTPMNEKLGERITNWTLKETPMGRWGRPEEIAQAALYLASDESSFITGTALVVDGGWVAR